VQITFNNLENTCFVQLVSTFITTQHYLG
jgi:hypothetical protein